MNAPVTVSGHINLSNNTNVSYTSVGVFANEVAQNGTGLYKDDIEHDFNAGTLNNMKTAGSGIAANLTSSSMNVSGSFGSRIFDGVISTNWTNISISTEAAYGMEIGRATGDDVGDGFSITDDSLVDVVESVVVRNEMINQLTVSNPSSSTTNNLPLNSLTPARREDNAGVNFSTEGGWIKKTTMPQNSFGGNIALLRKSESLESKTKDFSFASEANLPFLVPLTAYSAESPLDSRNLLISILMFSSSRNFGESDILLPADGFGSIFQSIPYHFLSNAGIASDYALHTFPSSNQFNNVTNQNPGALEGRLSMADFSVRDYVFADFGSHGADNGKVLFKGIGNS